MQRCAPKRSDNLPLNRTMEAVVSIHSNAGQVRLWWVRPVDSDHRIDEAQGHVFAGDEEAMVKHINELHQKTGIRQAAQSSRHGP